MPGAEPIVPGHRDGHGLTVVPGRDAEASSAWTSYDSVAATYEQVARPWFAPIAGDLVEALALAPGERFLDIGTGTGLVAALATGAVGSRGVAIGVDPSVGMLQFTRGDERVLPVAGRVPGLPLATATMDAAAANFVLSHLPDLDAGLTDIVRVLRPGGRFGATAWALQVPGGPAHNRPEADEALSEVKTQCGLDLPPPVDDPVPWEEALRDRRRLETALAQAGLAELEVARRRYTKTFSVTEFLAGWGSQGRYLRHAAGEERWRTYVAKATEALAPRFAGGITHVNDVWIAVGRRPA
jgi:SAM-dependent methyltransferase